MNLIPGFVYFGVFRLGHNLKILDSVVQLVSVNMVNHLAGAEGAPESSLHDQAVLIGVFIINANNPVASHRDGAALKSGVVFAEAPPTHRGGWWADLNAPIPKNSNNCRLTASKLFSEVRRTIGFSQLVESANFLLNGVCKLLSHSPNYTKIRWAIQ